MKDSSPLSQFLQHGEGIIKAASASPLGIMALIVLGILILAYVAILVLNKKKSRHTQSGTHLVFVIATFGMLMIAWMISPSAPGTRNAPSQGDVTVNGSQTTSGDQSPAVGNMNGSSINYGKKTGERE